MNSLEFIAVDDGPFQSVLEFWEIRDMQERELNEIEQEMQPRDNDVEGTEQP